MSTHETYIHLIITEINHLKPGPTWDPISHLKQFVIETVMAIQLPIDFIQTIQMRAPGTYTEQPSTQLRKLHIPSGKCV